MTRSPEVLLAASEAPTLAYLERLVSVLGVSVQFAGSFEQARAWVNAGTSDLLVADVRMGDFNGLHLGWLRHFVSPQLPTIITHTDYDVSLAAEARKLGAPFLALPDQERRFLNLVDEFLMAEQARRIAAYDALPDFAPEPRRRRASAMRIHH